MIRTFSTFFFCLLCITAQSQFTFECVGDYITGSECPECTGQTTARLFNGLMIKKSGAYFKNIDCPYIIKVQGQNLVIQELVYPNPETVTINRTGTSFATITGFRDSIACMCAQQDSSWIGGIDTTHFVNASNATTHTLSLTPVPTGGSLQLAEGSGITLTTTGTALNGVVTIAATTGGANYQLFRDDGVDQTVRPNANFLQSVDINLQLTDDAGNTETEISADILPNAVDYAEIQQIGAASLLGNPTGAPANVSEITLGTGLSFVGTALTPADASITNEGILGVGNGGSNDALLTSNTSTANGVTYSGSNTILVTETPSANGGTIILQGDTSLLATVNDINAARNRDDSTWVKLNGSYANKRINDIIYRTNKVGIRATDTLGYLNIRDRASSGFPAISVKSQNTGAVQQNGAILRHDAKDQDQLHRNFGLWYKTNDQGNGNWPTDTVPLVSYEFGYNFGGFTNSQETGGVLGAYAFFDQWETYFYNGINPLKNNDLTVTKTFPGFERHWTYIDSAAVQIRPLNCFRTKNGKYSDFVINSMITHVRGHSGGQNGIFSINVNSEQQPGNLNIMVDSLRPINLSNTGIYKNTAAHFASAQLYDASSTIGKGTAITIGGNGVFNTKVGILAEYTTTNFGGYMDLIFATPNVDATSLEKRVWVKSGSAVLVGVGEDDPTQALHVTGNARITGAIYDSNNEAGTSGQVLSTTVTGTDWISAATGTVTGSGANTQIAFWTSATNLSGSNNNTWDGTTHAIIGKQNLNIAGSYSTSQNFYNASGTVTSTANSLSHNGFNFTPTFENDGIVTGNTFAGMRLNQNTTTPTAGISYGMAFQNTNTSANISQLFGAEIRIDENSTSGNLSNRYAARFNTYKTSNAFDSHTGRGISVLVNELSSTGRWNIGYGGEFNVTNAIISRGIYSAVNSNKGTGNTQYGVYIENNTTGSGVVVNDAIGVNLSYAEVSGASITNYYGLFSSAAPIATTNYGIYLGAAGWRNWINGNFTVGSSNINVRTLNVSGEVRITDLTTDNPTRLVGADADGDLNEVTMAGGLSISGTTITMPTGTVNQTLRHNGTVWIASSEIINDDAAVGIGGNPVSGFELYVNGAQRNDGALVSRGVGSDFTANLAAPHLRLWNTTATTGDTWFLGSEDDGDFSITSSNLGAIQVLIENTTGDVGIGNAAPTQKLHVTGSARVTGAFYDSNNSPGGSGEVLSSTVTGTDWIAAGGGGITAANNGLYVSGGTTVRLGTNPLIEATLIDQDANDMRFFDGKWSYTDQTVSWTPTQGFGIEGTEASPTTSSSPTKDAIVELRASLSNVAQPNSLSIGAYTTDADGIWIQARSHANPSVEYPLSLQPRGGQASIGRLTGLDAQFTVTAIALSGSTVSGSVIHFENTEGNQKAAMTFGVGSDVADGELAYFDATDATRVTNRNTTTGTSSVRFAVGGETSDRVTIVAATVTPSARMGVGTTAPNSTVHSAGSFAGAFTSTTAATTLDERHWTVNYTGSANVTFTLPAASTCPGREYIIMHHGSGGTITLSLAVTKGNASTFNTITAAQWAHIISNGTNWRGFKQVSL